MTPSRLETALAAELKMLLSDERFDNSNGTAEVIRVYEHDVPIRSGADEAQDDADLPEPYIVVRLVQGSTPSGEDAEAVTVNLIICVCDTDTKRVGHKDILHITDIIKQRFEADPLLGGQFVFKYPFDWVLQDGDTYPYVFGGIQMTFEVPTIARDNPLT